MVRWGEIHDATTATAKRFSSTPMLSGGLFGAKRRKGRPVDGRQAGNELEQIVRLFAYLQALALLKVTRQTAINHSIRRNPMMKLPLNFRVGLMAVTFVVSGIMAVFMFCFSFGVGLWGWMMKAAWAYVDGGFADTNLIGLMLLISIFLLAGSYFQWIAKDAARFVLSPE